MTTAGADKHLITWRLGAIIVAALAVIVLIVAVLLPGLSASDEPQQGPAVTQPSPGGGALFDQ